MKAINILLPAVLIALVAVGCRSPEPPADPIDPVEQAAINKGAQPVPSSNPQSKAFLLSEVDDCKVYRLELRHEQVYFTKCAPAVNAPKNARPQSTTTVSNGSARGGHRTTTVTTD